MGTEDIVTVGKDIYYRNVFLFTEQIKELAIVKGAQLIRTNVNTCLRGAALRWYTAELNDMERSGLRSDDGLGINLWLEALIKRFHPHQSVALASLTSEKYTVQDARNHRETADYLQTIL